MSLGWLQNQGKVCARLLVEAETSVPEPESTGQRGGEGLSWHCGGSGHPCGLAWLCAQQLHVASTLLSPFPLLAVPWDGGFDRQGLASLGFVHSSGRSSACHRDTRALQAVPCHPGSQGQTLAQTLLGPGNAFSSISSCAQLGLAGIGERR